MVSACVLVYCEAGAFPNVAKGVKKLAGVKRAFQSLGRCDVVAEVEAADLKALSEIALKVATMKGVIATETLVEVTA